MNFWYGRKKGYGSEPTQNRERLIFTGDYPNPPIVGGPSANPDPYHEYRYRYYY